MFPPAPGTPWPEFCSGGRKIPRFYPFHIIYISNVFGLCRWDLPLLKSLETASQRIGFYVNSQYFKGGRDDGRRLGRQVLAGLYLINYQYVM